MSSRLFRTLCLCLLLAAALSAQTTSTEVLGTVTPSGAVISGAKVTLLRAATGQSREVTTSSDGNYSFPLVDVGEYSVRVEAQGFQSQEKTRIVLDQEPIDTVRCHRL